MLDHVSDPSTEASRRTTAPIDEPRPSDLRPQRDSITESSAQQPGKRMPDKVLGHSPDASQSTADSADAPSPSKPRPGLPEDAPRLTDDMSADQKVALTQQYLARRKGEGAFKSNGYSAEQVQAGAKSMFEASKTTIGGVIGKGIDEGAGVNVVAHAQNALLATQIGAAVTARQNPINIARQEAARVDNVSHSKQLHSSVEDWKNNKGQGLLSSLPASGEERKAGAQALMDTHGEAEFNKRYKESKGNKAIFAMAKKLAANNRLLAHEKKMGGEVLSPWTQEQSVGEAVPEHMAAELTPGHTIADSDVVASSMKGKFNRGMTSLNPMSDRPMGNTAKLDDEQKMRLDTYRSVHEALTQKASDDKADRASLKKADPTSRGYRPDELTRRAELKDQLDTLNKAKADDRKHRDKLGFGYLPGQRDLLKGHDDEMSKIVDPYRKAQLAPHEAEYDALHKHTVPKWKRTITSGKLPEAETKELADSEAELEKHTKNGKSDDHEIQMHTEQLRSRINELKAQKNSGLTPDEYNRKKSAKAEIDRIKKADASELNMSPADQALYDHHQSSKDDIEFQRTHGLNRQQKEDFDAATEERTSQKATRDTGLTDGERELKGFVSEQRTEVHKEAQTGHAFVNQHAGEEVSSLGRVGGLDSSDAVSQDKMAVTTAGRAAQMTRSAGSGVSLAGDVLNASKKNIQKAIDDGELLKASAQLAGSVTGDVLATAGNVQIPGVGTVSKHGLKAMGKALQGGGRVLHAAGDSLSQGQDKRDRQRELTSGDRLAATHKQAINFGKLGDKKLSLGAEVAGGLKGIANSGLEPIDDLKKDLSDKASSALDHATQGLGSVPSNVTHAISNSVEMPKLTMPHVDLHQQMSMPQISPTESVSVSAPSLNHLSAPALPIVAPAVNLPELASPEFKMSAEHEEEPAIPATDAEHDANGGEHADHAGNFTLSEPNHSFLKPEQGVEEGDVHAGTHEEGDIHANEEVGEPAGRDSVSDKEEVGEPAGRDSVSDKEEEGEEEEEEADKEEPGKVEKGPVKATDEEGPGGITHHDNYKPLFDRLSKTPTVSQVITRGASNAWSSVKNAFGFGKKDNLNDHIGTARRDRSVKPMLDRLSASQSLSARLGKGASRAWSSVKGFFGAGQAPKQTPEEDNLASHIGDTIRPRRRTPKI